jgi:hypothetical protein
MRSTVPKDLNAVNTFLIVNLHRAYAVLVLAKCEKKDGDNFNDANDDCDCDNTRNTTPSSMCSIDKSAEILANTFMALANGRMLPRSMVHSIVAAHVDGVFFLAAFFLEGKRIGKLQIEKEEASISE